MTTKKNGLLLAIDANSLLHRAYHAYPLSLVTSDGRPVNAVYGFTSMLLDALLKYKPEYVFCAFDTNKPTFRHTEYIGYKANRPKTDSELVDQIGLVDEVLHALNIPIIRIEGYEADDILGTVVKQVSQDVLGPVSFSYILTGDRDLFQLVDEKIQAVLPKGSFKNLQEYGDDEVIKSTGVPPNRIADLKGLMGDVSDNIPGVKGVGPKTAADLITTYGTVEEIYQHLGEISQKSKNLANKLILDQEVAYMSKHLATIATDAPVPFQYEKALTSDFSMQEATAVFTQFQFKSLLPRLKKLAQETQHRAELPEKDILQEAQNGSLIDALHKLIQKVSTLSTKSIHLNVPKLKEKIAALAATTDSVTIKEVAGIEINMRLSILDEYLNRLEADSETHFIMAYVYKKLHVIDISSLELSVFGGVRMITFGLFDYLNDSPVGVASSQITRKNQEILIAIMAQNIMVDIPALEYSLSTGRGDYSIEDTLGRFSVAPNHTSDKLLLVALFRIFQEEVRVAEYENLERISDSWSKLLAPNTKMAIPLAIHQFEDKPSLFGVALMHLRGIGVDTQKILDYSKELEAKIAELEKAIFDDIGFEFNIRSTKQLGDILFSHLALPAKKKTKTGFSTDDEVLQELIPAHPAIEKVLQYRMYSKLLNTYIRPFIDLAVRFSASQMPKDESAQLSFASVAKLESYFRINSDFAPMSTSTGRLSSSNPNLQNLPIKTEQGKEIRTFFVPEKDHVLLSFDYSQIDLRVMAHISGDLGLTAAFKENQDIHRATASKIFDVPFDKVDDGQRRIAKTVNFGLLYGMSAFGLSRSINTSVHEADKFMKAYFESFPSVKTYMEETTNFAKMHGYVLSLLGRRRYIYGLDSNNQHRRMAAQREAINMPIQGGADDIMRIALGKVSLLPDILSGKLKLVLQIHDELVFEAPDDEKYLESIIPQIKEIMENAVILAVPLKVEWAKGKNLSI